MKRPCLEAEDTSICMYISPASATSDLCLLNSRFRFWSKQWNVLDWIESSLARSLTRRRIHLELDPPLPELGLDKRCIVKALSHELDIALPPSLGGLEVVNFRLLVQSAVQSSTPQCLLHQKDAVWILIVDARKLSNNSTVIVNVSISECSNDLVKIMEESQAPFDIWTKHKCIKPQVVVVVDLGLVLVGAVPLAQNHALPMPSLCL